MTDTMDPPEVVPTTWGDQVESSEGLGVPTSGSTNDLGSPTQVVPSSRGGRSKSSQPAARPVEQLVDEFAARQGVSARLAIDTIDRLSELAPGYRRLPDDGPVKQYIDLLLQVMVEVSSSGRSADVRLMCEFAREALPAVAATPPPLVEASLSMARRMHARALATTPKPPKVKA